MVVCDPFSNVTEEVRKCVCVVRDEHSIKGEFVLDGVAGAADRPDVIVSEFVEQHAYARTIAPMATNTVRLLTMIDPDSGQPFIAAASHRFGTSSSAPADNFSSGGLAAAIDTETGRLGEVAVRSPEVLKRGRSHPETGERITDVRVPDWSAVREVVLEAALTVSHLPYIGWDIVVTEDGPRILEGNHYPNVRTLQIHGPLLTDDRVESFYEHHGVV